VLTVDFRRFPVRPGHRVLDLGCGGGRHAFEVYRRGANVVAFDLDPAELTPVTAMFGAMQRVMVTALSRTPRPRPDRIVDVLWRQIAAAVEIDPYAETPTPKRRTRSAPATRA